MNIVRKIFQGATGKRVGGGLGIGLLAALTVVTHREWFAPGSIISYGDIWFRFGETMRENFGLFVWSDGVTFGGPNIEIYKFVFYVLWGSLANMGLRSTDILRLTHLIPIAVLGYAAPYILLRHLTRNNLVAGAGAVFYGSTTFLIVREQLGHASIALAAVLTPLLLYLFMRALAKNTWRQWLTFILAYWVGVGYEVRIMLIVTGLLGLYFLVRCLPDIRKYAWKIAVMGFLLVLLCFYWLLPALFGGIAENVDAVASRGLFGNTLLSLPMSLTLFNHSWTGALPMHFKPQPIPSHFWLWPVLLFALFIFPRNEESRRDKIFFGIVYVLGLFLMKQVDEPFPGVFPWLRNYVPGFIVFRSGSKFDFLLAIGCLGILGLGLGALRRQWSSGWRRRIWSTIIIVVVALSLANLKPLFTEEIGGMFVRNQIPADYATFHDFLMAQTGSFFRILWIPTDSRWSFYLNEKPKVPYVQVLDSPWGGMVSEVDASGRKLDSWERMVAGLRSEFADQLLGLSSIRYVAVPISDTKNNDEFFQNYGGKDNPEIRAWYISQLDQIPYLKRVDLGTDELAIFENANYKKPIFAFGRLFLIEPGTGLEPASGLIRDVCGDDFLIVSDDKNKNSDQATRILDVFGQVPAGVKGDDAFSFRHSTADGRLEKLYFNQGSGRSIVVERNGSSINVKRLFSLGLVAGDSAIPDGMQKKLDSNPHFVKAGSSPEYFVEWRGKINKLEQGTPLVLQESPGGDILNILTVDANVLTDGSFEDGSWLDRVGDCYAYDADSKLAMSLDEHEKTDGACSLRLEAMRHIACTFTKIVPDASGDFIFSFDYQSPNAQKAGYYLVFDDDAKTVVKETLTIDDTGWRTLTHRVTVPAGATSAHLYLYAYESDRVANNIVRYDHVQFRHLRSFAAVSIPAAEGFEEIPVSLKVGENTFGYRDARFDYANLLSNPSFEGGLWQDEVGDCNNRDDNGLLAMSLDAGDKTDGRQSLRLEATRHVACTRTVTEVKGGLTYLLSFDYQSPNAEKASFYVGFNDPAKTRVSESPPLADTAWRTFSKIIAAPPEATSLSLYVYAKETDGRTNIINRYDNFKLIEVPDLRDAYYLVSEPERKLEEPRAVDFELVNPTKKLVHVSGVTTPFFLAMSESYHDKWQLQMANGKIRGWLNDWGPWVRPDRVADEFHYKLDGFLNAWYVDVDAWCAAGNNPACRRNADGSWDMDLVIEFWPQRWFYLGLLISGLTLAGCLGYLGFKGTQALRRRYGKKKVV